MVALVPVEPVAKDRRMQEQLKARITVTLNRIVWEPNLGGIFYF
jgi:hypothetical protein